MHASDDEQGINKLSPYQRYICDYLHIIVICESIVTTGRLHWTAASSVKLISEIALFETSPGSVKCPYFPPEKL